MITCEIPEHPHDPHYLWFFPVGEPVEVALCDGNIMPALWEGDQA